MQKLQVREKDFESKWRSASTLVLSQCCLRFLIEKAISGVFLFTTLENLSNNRKDSRVMNYQISSSIKLFAKLPRWNSIRVPAFLSIEPIF